MLTPQQSDRLDELADLHDGWFGFGLGDRPTPLALTAARDLLDLLPAPEQDTWRVDADPEGGLRFERHGADPQSDPLVFVDIDRRGAARLVWFDDRNREHQRHYPQADDCAASLGSLLDITWAAEPALAAA